MDVINDSESYQSTPPLTMQTQTLDGSFNQTLPLSEHPHGHFGQTNGLNNSDSTRSQSRSTDSSSEGSQQSAAAPAEQQPPSVSSTTTTQIPNLNAALQQSLESSTFPNFNNQG
ncbi:unnamed protein product [Auanema sp. JU1783]|nr:unnamed protein product [Auanema sp. JU1783]